MKTFGVSFVSLIVLACATRALAVEVLPEEMADAARWAAARFQGVAETREAVPGLTVLENYGPVQANGRDGQPLRIAGKTYSHGLYCHANSRILARLPGPGKTFSAVVGVDTNGSYSGGSIVFAVSVGAREVFASAVLTRGQEGLPVTADLSGATEFLIAARDGGDTINSDQAAWAEATVAMEDGSVIRIGDLPLIQFQPAPYTTEAPFSFVYGAKSFSELVKTWEVERSEQVLDAERVGRAVTYTDPNTGLVVRCDAVVYKDFPTVEWTLHFKNTGAADTPILSDIRALDTRFERTMDGEFTLHRHTGTLVNRSDYEPHSEILAPKIVKTLAPREGRPCAGEFPYYNVEWSGRGVIAVIGWPGRWSAEFVRDEGVGLRIAAGQELTHFTLKPGEEVRSPLIVLQFWKGDYARSQNVWRRWMIAHNLPRRNGNVPPPQMPAVSGNQFPGLLCNEADEIRYIDRYEEERIPITHWWMDAGWYLNKGDWTSTGTWEVDKARFPRGIRAVADHAHAKGLKLIVWFEPERVTAGSWLAENHPEWVLGGKQGGLLNLGDPDAWRWLVERYDRIITDEGIDYYRQDFNMDPLPYWRAHDTEDRQGITEIRHVEGYLAFWDELVRRHPDMMIDSCASGGHRNDLETMRRSVPLLRSDAILDPIGEQCHTYGFASWIPYWGTGFIDYNAWVFHSCLGLDTTLSCDARRTDLDWDLLRKLTQQWRELAPNFYGDYYPLTPYSQAEDTWIGWQFHRPEAQAGMVQMFRRAQCIYESARVPLHGLDPDARYTVTNVDEGAPHDLSGSELLEQGLSITIPDKPAAVVVVYVKS